MAEPIHPPDFSDSSQERAPKLPPGWLSRWPWATFLLPMIIYMVVGTLEPAPPESPDLIAEESLEDSTNDGDPDEILEEENRVDTSSAWDMPYSSYPYVYSFKILLILIVMAAIWPGYRTFPWKVSGLSVLVGVVGVVLWVGLCHLNLEEKIFGPVDRFLGSLIPGLEEGEIPSVGLMSLFGSSHRSAFNPLEHLQATPVWAYTFLAIRFLGLALLVPIMEEFFLRGFLMRYMIHEQWWKVPFGTPHRTAILVGTVVPMLMHPGELLAALVWFSMVTWLMLRTRNIWDCVVAHAVTNFLLGVYVVVSGEWQLM